MALKTIGTLGDYTSIAAWAAYVKAIGTFTENEIGELIDDKNYTYGAASDGNLSSLTLSGNTVTLRAGSSVKHNGDFVSGARMAASVGWGAVFNPNQLNVDDFWVENTHAHSFSAFHSISKATLNRCIARHEGTNNGDNKIGFLVYRKTTLNSCRAERCGIGFRLAAVSATTTVLENCSAINCYLEGYSAYVEHFGTIKNCLSYACTTDWGGTSGVFSGTYSNNASEDGTHAGTSGVTITANPFDADGYTPTSGGQLDGAGVNLSISLDAANNSFNNPPSIGAYEVIATGGLTYKTTITPSGMVITLDSNMESIGVDGIVYSETGIGTTSPSTFQVAWALNSNIMIQSGMVI